MAYAKKTKAKRPKTKMLGKGMARKAGEALKSRRKKREKTMEELFGKKKKKK